MGKAIPLVETLPGDVAEGFPNTWDKRCGDPLITVWPKPKRPRRTTPTNDELRELAERNPPPAWWFDGEEECPF